MAADAIEFDVLRLRADITQAVGQFLLLVNRKQDVGRDTDDQGPFQL